MMSQGWVRSVLRSMAWAPLALVVACGGSTTGNALGSGAAAGAAGQGSGSGGTSTGGGAGTGSGGSATGGAAGTGGASGAGGSGATGGSGGAGGGSCSSSSDCAPGEVCGFAEAAACSAQGRCFKRGPVCNSFVPGCGCNGQTFNTTCAGLPTGYVTQPLAHSGQCATPDAGTGFACGSSLKCDPATQYCSVVEGGPCCQGPRYSCQNFPSACANNHTCACLKAQTGPSQCSESGGDVTVTLLAP